MIAKFIICGGNALSSITYNLLITT